MYHNKMKTAISTGFYVLTRILMGMGRSGLMSVIYLEMY